MHLRIIKKVEKLSIFKTKVPCSLENNLQWKWTTYYDNDDNESYGFHNILKNIPGICVIIALMSSTITMPIGGWLQTFNDFFCFTFSLKPNLCLQVKLFLLIIVKAKNQKTTLLSLRKYPWKMKNRANFGCNA